MTTCVAVGAWVDIGDDRCRPMEVEPCCPPSGSQDLQVVCWGMTGASIDDVGVHGGSQQTTFSRSSGVAVDVCHLDNLLILMLE